jgi:hypothetical protein
MNTTARQAHNKQQKLLVCLFSDPNFLALNILENLLSNNCVVNIISDNEKIWREKTEHIAEQGRFFVTSLGNYKKITNFSYAIFCGGFVKKQTALEDFKVFISNKNFGTAKTLAVFPFETFSHKNSGKIAMTDNAGIVYVGDLLGARIDLNSNLLVPGLIKEMIEKRTLTMGIGELFYPLLVSEASRVITNWLLSFGPYGKETFLLGELTSTSEFWKQNIKSFPDLKIIYDTDIETRVLPKGYDTKRVDTNLGDLLLDTYRWIIQDKLVVKEVRKKDDKTPKTKVKRFKHLKAMRPFLTVAFLVLLFPVLTTLISGGLLYFSYRDFLNDKINASQKKALMAKTVFVIGKHESDVLQYIPLLGRLYKETSFISYIGKTGSDVFAASVPLAQTGKGLTDKILGNGVYDVNQPAGEIKSGLEYLYQQISLTQVYTEEKALGNVLSAKQLLNIVDFNKTKNLIQQGIVLANGMPDLLGHEKNKNYLVLFQNNMELRPTGGFIGSYGIATFGGGKLNGLTVNDIYSADGQLRGHVEPPTPIKKYLNEANWWFRDSNWDPDFPTSAKRAEWFLEKEMGQKVDGVVTVDLTPIKNILNYTGPIFLPDYNLTITADNLYEKTQEEAHANFFPGSRKKASFLTALSRVLISEVTNMDSGQRIGVLRSLYDGLEGRSIQVFLHDETVQSAVGKLNWDGRLPIYSCGNGCYSDFFGDVEANLGVNKSNYFVSRKIGFMARIDQQKITRELDLNITNRSNPSLGPSGQYKPYIRILIPLDADVLEASVVEGQNVEEITPDITKEDDRQEVGAFIEINSGQTKSLKLRWESNIPDGQEIKSYGLFVRKQAGTVSDPVTIKITAPGPAVFSLPQFALTREGDSTYNTTLSKDFFARLSWK